MAFTTDPISDVNAAAAAFQITLAEVGATFDYTITSSGGGTPVAGSGTISTATQNVTGVNVSGLNDGTLTLSLTLTDLSGNTGLAATDTVVKAFAPTDISNIALWLDAADTSSITASGGAVSQWNDKSGNARHATQGTPSNRPTSGSRTLNGLNVLDFVRTSQHVLELPSGMFGVSAGPNTVIIVASADDTTNNHRLYQGSISGTVGVSVRYASTTTMGVQNRTTLTLTNITITRNTNPHVFGFRRSGTSITPFYDGTEGSTASTAQDATLTTLGIGRDPAATTDSTDGLFAEVLVFAKSLSNAELNKVGNYLASKWGVTWAGV
ncbi:hypothetical protein [Tautonia marina]|uniref:hypothetical protein n=1 Tax=Tautonia marina TaxID=2653855 RepID=UPI00126071B3|nr:hypothetical protein [Tautonia marina]